MAEWISLFRSAHDGYGDYRRQSDTRYHLSIGIDSRVAGQLSLCPPTDSQYLSTAHKDTPTRAVVWEDDEGLAFFCAAGNKLVRCGHTTTVEDLSGTSAAQGLVLHHAAGTEALYISYGNDAFISKRIADSTISQDDSEKCYQMESLDDGRLVRVETNQYQIKICAAAGDPFAATDWGGAITVGRPSEKITGLVHIGEYIIVCKEDGVYFYNPVSTTFINLTPSISIHPDNGKGAAAIGGLGVLVPLANGDVVLVDQSMRAQSVGPMKDALPGRDTPTGRITAIVYGGEWGYAYQEPYMGKTRGAGQTSLGLGTKVLIDNDGVFTDYSAAAVDNNSETVVELTGLGGAASADYLYVGANYPFEGCYVTIDAPNATDDSGIASAQYYNGSAWTGLTLDDRTYSSVEVCSLARSGYLGWSNYNIPALMAAVAVNGITRYWVRFRFDQTAAVV